MIKNTIKFVGFSLLMLLPNSSMMVMADVAPPPEPLKRIGYEFEVTGLHSPESILHAFVQCGLLLIALAILVGFICRLRWKGFFLACGMFLGIYVLDAWFLTCWWKRAANSTVQLQWGEKRELIQSENWKESCGLFLAKYLHGYTESKYECEVSDDEKKVLHARVDALAPELQREFDVTYNRLQADGKIERCGSIEWWFEGIPPHHSYDWHCRRVRESNHVLALTEMLLHNHDLAERCMGIPFQYIKGAVTCPEPEGVSTQKEIEDFEGHENRENVFNL